MLKCKQTSINRERESNEDQLVICLRKFCTPWPNHSMNGLRKTLLGQRREIWRVQLSFSKQRGGLCRVKSLTLNILVRIEYVRIKKGRQKSQSIQRSATRSATKQMLIEKLGTHFSHMPMYSWNDLMPHLWTNNIDVSFYSLTFNYIKLEKEKLVMYYKMLSRMIMTSNG